MLRRSAVLVCLWLAGIAPAKADFASEALLHDFLRTVDASPDWSASAAAVRSEGADTIGERLVISRNEPDVSVTVDRLRLRDLREAAAGGFSAAEIELTGGALVSPESELRVPTASVRSASMPSAEGLAYDPHHLMTFLARLYSALAQAEFVEFSVPEATAIVREVGTVGETAAPSRITYRNLLVTALRDGVLERTQAGPISVEGRGADGDFRFGVESVSGDRFDVAAFAHIFDTARYRDGRGDGVWRPLVSRIDYSGLSATGPDGAAFRLASAAVENVDGRQPDKPFTSLWDRILDPSVPEEARSELALEALQDYAAMWRVGTIRLDDFSLEDAQNSASARLGMFTLSGLSQEGIDSVLLKDVSAESPDGSGKLDTLELAGLLFPDTDALVKFAALENDASAAKHAQTLRGAFAGLPRFAHFGVHGLSGGVSRAEAVRLDLLTLDFRKWNDIFAEETDLRIEGVDIPVDLLEVPPEQAEILDTLGYERLVLGTSFSDRWSPQSGIDTGSWTFTLKDGVDVALTYAVTGVTLDWMLKATAEAGKGADGEAALKAMLNDLRLEAAQLSVTDRSLLDRAFAVAAKKQGLTVGGAAYREQMRSALPFLLSAALPAELSKLVSGPLQEFLAGGQTLVADISPPVPFPLLEFADGVGDPLALANRLGLTLKTEPPQ
jgi:hypothetical protein